MSMNTAQSIMSTLEEYARDNRPLDWEAWMRGAGKLNALLQSEDEKLAEMEHELIKQKANYIEEGYPANKAKLLVEEDDLYLAVMKQRAFIKRCEETIRVAKKMATLARESYANTY